MVLNLGANQYTGSTFSAKACFKVAGNITTRVSTIEIVIYTERENVWLFLLLLSLAVLFLLFLYYSNFRGSGS